MYSLVIVLAGIVILTSHVVVSPCGVVAVLFVVVSIAWLVVDRVHGEAVGHRVEEDEDIVTVGNGRVFWESLAERV